MTNIQHLNCGILHAPPTPKAICHCLLLEDANGLALVDTGIGQLETRNPLERIGKKLIDLAGFQFHEELTAIHQIQQLGYSTEDVKHIILTHCDNDHCGGVADFPNATVHLSIEELQAFRAGSYRYLPQQFEHNPKFVTYDSCDTKWFGMEARKIDLPFSSSILLVPLFGHTAGHCGVAIEQRDSWLLHVGDAYYLRAELSDENHPVNQLAEIRAENNLDRLDSLDKIRKLLQAHGDQIETIGYHDPSEL